VIDGRTLSERVYCARGEMENRIKEQQLELFADRTSAATMRAKQLRLWLASFAYLLLEARRRIGLRHTQFQEATCGTIRLKLLKLGARVTVSVRRITVAIASACRYRTAFALDPSAARALDRPAASRHGGLTPAPARPTRCLSPAPNHARRWRKPLAPPAKPGPVAAAAPPFHASTAPPHPPVATIARLQRPSILSVRCPG
jgi:Transposase DDE domain group 1